MSPVFSVIHTLYICTYPVLKYGTGPRLSLILFDLNTNGEETFCIQELHTVQQVLNKERVIAKKKMQFHAT